jgi:hypothetical protein
MSTRSQTLPGFNAEVALRKTSTHYRTVTNNVGKPANVNGGMAIPQFSFHSFVCAALVAGILAGQEELIPVLANAGCLGSA